MRRMVTRIGCFKCEESRRHRERPHPFWDTQPVPAIGSEYSQDSGPIDEIKKPKEVRDEPYNLPDSFEWCTCNVDDDAEATEIYTLLIKKPEDVRDEPYNLP